MSDGISSQGTLVLRQPGGSGAFVEVAELKNIKPPALTRNPIEMTNQNDDYDSFVVGIKRRGELSFQVNFLPATSGSTGHDALTGLINSWDDGDLDGWKITYPDGADWIFSGYITNVAPDAPVDGALVADITIKPTGSMIFE